MRDNLMPIFGASLAKAQQPCREPGSAEHAWVDAGYDDNGLMAKRGSEFDTSDGRLQSCLGCGAVREVDNG